MAINNCVGRDIVVSTNTNVSGDISMKTFSPTYLYIKQHSVTGKLYFGKTKNNPEKYLGSGTYWLNHINKHGKEHVVTLWYCLFLNKPELVDFATAFSTEQCIVESTTWANLAIETGLDGGYRENNMFVTWSKLPKSTSTKQKMSESQKGKCNKSIPVLVDGTFYPSATEAARQLHVSDQTILNWQKNGRTIKLK